MPKKIFMSTDSADLANFSYKGVYVSLTIDTRKWTVTQRDEAGRPAEHDQAQELPIVLRVTKDSKRLYLPIGEKYTWNNWLEMCKHEQSTRVRADSEKRANLKQHLAKIKPTICEMADAGTFSLVRLKTYITELLMITLRYILFGMNIFKRRKMMARLVPRELAETSGIGLSKTTVWTLYLPTLTILSYRNGQRR